jgi:cob(I)alamin adenosyltransferase
VGGISTGAGDDGETSLADGSRVRKDDARVEAYGMLDEAASAIGLARVVVDETPLDLLLAFSQQRLLNAAAVLAAPNGSAVAPPSADDVAALERAADDLIDMAGGFRGFTLPGGTELGARLHVARTVVRRAERRLVELASAEKVEPTVLAFVNRLSDTLYAAARYANSRPGDEESWDDGFPAPQPMGPRD